MAPLLLIASVLALLSLGIGLFVLFRAAARKPGPGQVSSAGGVDYLSFQEAQERLSLDDAALKALVVADELRGYRAGASMKFRSADVEALRAKRSGAGVEVRKTGSASKEHCPFCHDRVEALEQVVCVACLARHHEACWDDHSQCATCGARERFTGVESTQGRAERARNGGAEKA